MTDQTIAAPTLTTGQKIYGVFKRGMDILCSILGLIVLAIPFAILAIAIRSDDHGPVFFRQERVGRNREPFTMLKFRTMRTDTPHDVPTHMLADPMQYLTRTGRFLRRTSLDELPQLINILKGEMSVVGPRPALWNQTDLNELRESYGVHQVRPGLTGWAQINGRDELEVPVKAALDGEYLRRFGIAMDIRCFFGTFLPVLSQKGVVEGGTGAMQEEASTREMILIATNHSFMLWQFRRELIGELLQEHDVLISAPKGEHWEDFEAMGCRMADTAVDRRGVNPITDIKLFFRYWSLLRREKPALVITYSIKPNIYAGFACRLLGIPCCANVQGLGTAFQSKNLAAFVSLLYEAALKKSRTVFFENEANAALFREWKIIPAERQCILSGAGVNLEYHTARPYPHNEPVRFLYLSRLMKEKGVSELFSAARRLHEEGHKFILDVVGFYDDVEYETQVTQLQADGIAVFHGFQPDPRPYYAAADCVVLASYHEGMSNVLLEGAATGRPLITSDIPGCREAVEPEVTGLLCQPKDEESLYWAMKDFLALSPERRAAMGEAGRRRMEERFDRTAVVKATIANLGI